MEIREVDYGSEDYRKMVDLREKILRVPLGRRFNPAYLEQDKDDWHIAAFENGNVIGTVLVKPLDGQTVKVRQVAVDTLLQGKGIGRRLMEFAEDLARQRGYKRSVLHARFYTIAFYKKLGYRITSGPFDEVGMEHYRMEKEL